MSTPQKSFGGKLHKQGKSRIGTMLESADRSWTEKAILILYLILSSPVWGGLLLVYMYWIREEWVLNLGAVTSVISLITSWWQSKITADFIFDEQMSFRLAFKATIFSSLMKLTFIPIVGSVFEHLLTHKKSKKCEILEQARHGDT